MVSKGIKGAMKISRFICFFATFSCFALFCFAGSAETPRSAPAESFALIRTWTTEKPHGLALDKDGYLYVAGGNKVKKFKPDGTLVIEISVSTLPGLLTYMGVALDSTGNIYVATGHGSAIVKYNATGTFIKKWGTGGSKGLLFPIGIAVDSLNNVYVSDQQDNRIVKYDSEGTFLAEWGSRGSGDGQFDSIWGLRFDASGKLHVADGNNNTIKVFSGDGTFLRKYGASPPSSNPLMSPKGMDIDAEGNSYIAERGANMIAIFDALGNRTNYINPADPNIRFEDIVIDADGYIFAAGYDNNQIRVYRSTWLPALEITSPLADAIISGTHTIQATATSDLGISKVEIYVDSVKIGEATAAQVAARVLSGNNIAAAAAVYTYAWNTAGYVDGPHALKLIAYNTQNKTAQKEISVIVNNSNDQLPTVSITNPLTGDKVRLGTTIRATATDDKGVAKVEFYVDGAKIGEDTSSPFEFVWDASALTDGTHEVKATAYDTISQPKSATISVTVVNHEEYGFVKKWAVTGPFGLSFDNYGNILVGSDWRIRKFSPEGIALTEFSRTVDGPFEFDLELYPAVDSGGNIYVSNSVDSNIIKLDANGKFIKQWGSMGSENTQFKAPKEIVVDPQGNIYIADEGNCRIVKYDTNGTFIAQWGSLGAGDGQFIDLRINNGIDF